MMTKDIESCTVELSNDSVNLSNGLVIVSYDMRLGLLSLTSSDKASSYFSRGYILVHTEKEVFDSRRLTYKGFSTLDYKDSRGDGKAIVLQLHDPDRRGELNLKLSVIKGVKGYLCVAQFKNRSGKNVCVKSIEPLVIDVDKKQRVYTGWDNADLMFFRHGFHSWELTHALPLSAGENLSHNFSVLHNKKTKDALVLGFVSMADQLTTVAAYGDKTKGGRLAQIVVTSIADNVSLADKEVIVSEEMVILVSNDGMSALDQYVKLVADHMKPVTCDSVPTGWCSWYFYYTQPDEREVIANAKFLKQRMSDYIGWIQLDDGYQTAVGDWETNERFPSGLDALADNIKSLGLKAGIWTAPFIASEHSALLKDHPDWFVRDKEGQPIVVGENPLWLGNFYALDLTNPKVLDFIENLFTDLKEQGYEYFKIDFLYHAIEKGHRMDDSLTRAQAMRQGLEAVRKGVGDSIILGCGAPIGQCIGITNAMRIGTDIGTAWRWDWGAGVYECAINTMTRQVFHNRLWLNDPDCVLVRQDDNDLTLKEIQLWATVIALSGGLTLLSDRMMEVSEERLKILDVILPPYRKGGRVVDALERSEPSLFVLPIDVPMGQWAIVGLINLSEKPMIVPFGLEKIGLDPSVPHHVFNFWEQNYEGIYEEVVGLSEIPPHSCRLLCVKPESRLPIVLSTSIHFTQGAIELKDFEWNSTRLELSVTIAKDCRSEETVFFVPGEKFIPEKAKLDDDVIPIETPAPEVISVRGSFRRGQTITVFFKPV